MGMTEQQIVETLATKVMGWRKTDQKHPVYDFEGRYEGDTYWIDDDGDPVMLEHWNPLQNIADAWMIVEKIGSPEEVVRIIKLHDDGRSGYLCSIRTKTSLLKWPRIDFSEEGETAQEAICKAAMKLIS